MPIDGQAVSTLASLNNSTALVKSAGAEYELFSLPESPCLVVNVALSKNRTAMSYFAALCSHMIVCHSAVPLDISNDGLKVRVRRNTRCDMGEKPSDPACSVLYCPASSKDYAVTCTEWSRQMLLTKCLTRRCGSNV